MKKHGIDAYAITVLDSSTLISLPSYFLSCGDDGLDLREVLFPVKPSESNTTSRVAKVSE